MKHYKSVFDNEPTLLKALIELHNNGQDIELDPMYFKGNFYKDGLNKPKYIFDLNPQVKNCNYGDATSLPLEDESITSMILDPPFLFGIHGKTEQYYSSKTHTIFANFNELYKCYTGIIKEASRVLKNKGILFFKCQDYTDSKTTLTHIYVYQLAVENNFFAKDLAILVKPLKVYNGNTTQRHLRKIHTYFFVFEKINIFKGVHRNELY